MAQQIAFARTDLDHSFTYTNQFGQEITQARTIIGSIFVPDAPGTYPVVFYSHGHGGSPSGGAAVNARALADQGYIVVAPRHLDSLSNPQIANDFPLDDPASTLHRIADMQFLMDQLADLMTEAPGYEADASRATIAGHSHGAFTAALLAGAQSFKPGLDAPPAPGNEYGLTELIDERFTQAMLLSAQGAAGANSTFGLTEDSWDNLAVPSLIVTGTNDNDVDGQTYRHRLDGFEHGPAGGKHAIVIAGADHGQIGGGDTSDPAINDEVAQAMTAFLDAYVKDNAAAQAALDAPEAYANAHPLVIEAYQKSLLIGAGLGAVRGASGDDLLEGLSTHDVMRGRAGNDVLVGLAGNDTIYGGIGNDRLEGGIGADRLMGEGGHDRLIGGDGNDWLIAGGGNDTVDGGAGNDRIEGGPGQDRLTGSAGADRFVFASLAESAVGATRDVISDFDSAEGDLIDVSAIDARASFAGNNAFTFVGFNAFSGEGQIRVVQSGFSTIIALNTLGNNGAEMQVELYPFLAFNLSSSDFAA